MSGLAPENALAQDFQASFPSASGSSPEVWGSGPPAERQNSSRAESNCDIGNQDPSGLPLPRWSCCGPGAWPVRPAPRTRTREAKRAGRKTRTGAKRATSVFTLFRHPSSAATPGATSPVPPIAQASRWWGCAESGRGFPGAISGEFQRMKTSPCQAGDSGCKRRGRAKFHLAQEIFKG